LNDHLPPKAHRLRCGRNGFLVEFRARDGFDLEALRAEVVDIALLVAKPSLTRYIQERIRDSRFRKGSLGDREIKFGQTAAIEVPDEIGRTELDGTARPSLLLPANLPIFAAI
jgi:hypothetical protein